MDRLGLGYDDIRAGNPGLVYASGKGYGLSGPYADYPAMDLTVQAMTGVLSTTGWPDGPPVKTGPAICDFLGGIHLLAGVLAALYQRERTGEGQLVEVSMHDASLPTLASALGGLFNQPGRAQPERTGNRHSGLSVAPYNVYPTQDGYIALLCFSQRHWDGLVDAIGDSRLNDDERFADNASRVLNMDALDAVIGEWARPQSKRDAVDLLLIAGVPCAPVLTVSEVASDAHLRERGMIREIDHTLLGPTMVLGNPVRLSRSPLHEVTAAPALGEHTDRVLGALAGFDASELAELRSDRVIE
jgi:formyl-CoA transferase